MTSGVLFALLCAWHLGEFVATLRAPRVDQGMAYGVAVVAVLSGVLAAWGFRLYGSVARGAG